MAHIGNQVDTVTLYKVWHYITVPRLGNLFNVIHQPYKTSTHTRRIPHDPVNSKLDSGTGILH